ncbi:MAG: HEAT repeat domain-containing protein [Planctomycetaceae bacterium]|nr:HEAT repeat domain-containing protein [Planctomycetaceae bacterium]
MDDEIRDWLTCLQNPGFGSDDPQRVTAETVILKMKSLGPDRLFPRLREALKDPDPEFRCLGCSAICHIDPKLGIDLLLPMLDDPEALVRWHTCGLLHNFGDQRSVSPLMHILKTDPDPQVRNTAAYALGGIGDAIAIPALVEALDNDHELDELGYSTSSNAASALDDILGTNYTRTKLFENYCTLPTEPPDFELLKAEAMKYYLQQSLRT